MINEELADRLGVSQENRDKINQLHGYLDKLLSEPENVYSEYERVVTHIERIEFELQRLWGFEQNKAFHSYWFRVKGCTCPKLDNQEMVGVGRRIISGDCPFHAQ